MGCKLRTADCIDGRIVGVRDDQCKLGASVPTLLHALGVGIIEIDRDSIIRRSVRVSKREEKYPPEEILRLRKRTIAEENAPFMPAAIKLWAS